MAENIKAEIFGNDDIAPPDRPTFDDITSGTPDLSAGEDFDTDFSDFEVALADEDLDSSRSSYKMIPAGTRVNLTISACERSMTRSDKRKLTLDFDINGEEWGKNRRIRFKDVIFDPDPEYQWRWGQFLKAVGYISTAAEITPDKLKALFANPGQLIGFQLSATVIGHSWKQRPGTMDPAYPRSYGKDAQPVPTDGTRVFEDLSNWAPVQETDTNTEMRGLAEFVGNASSLETYL